MWVLNLRIRPEFLACGVPGSGSKAAAPADVAEKVSVLAEDSSVRAFRLLSGRKDLLFISWFFLVRNSPHRFRVGINPKRIGLISDTHGLLREEALRALRGSDLIVHAGRRRRAGNPGQVERYWRRLWQFGEMWTPSIGREACR